MASFTFDTDKLKAKGSKFPVFLQVLGVIGVLFYALGPVLFPDAPLRQPELLPVYTLMMGLGELIKPARIEEKDEH